MAGADELYHFNFSLSPFQVPVLELANGIALLGRIGFHVCHDTLGPVCRVLE
jgi:hypothetical protein